VTGNFARIGESLGWPELLLLISHHIDPKIWKLWGSSAAGCLQS
jgi:hypothetical protein